MASTDKIKGGILLVIGFMLVLILAAEMLPTALNTWFNVSTGAWGTVTAALWVLVPIFVVLGIIFYFLGQAFDLF